MSKDIRRKVMQIANRLVGQGRARAEAMLTAWKLIRYRALKTGIELLLSKRIYAILKLLRHSVRHLYLQKSKTQNSF